MTMILCELMKQPKKNVPMCHETTARAARLEQEICVTLVRPVSNALYVQEFRPDILGDSATLPQKKGLKGFVRGEA